MFGQRRIPVFIINGFLESGKTSFIRSAILRDPALAQERVVVICCEEGEVEYEDMPDYISVQVLDDKSDLTDDMLYMISEKYDPTYVIIEYNGVWDMDTLYNTSMPVGWQLGEQITIIDSETFEGYFSNMKKIFADQLRYTSRVFVNRCTKETNFKFFKDSIKPCAPRSEILYMNDDEGIMTVILEEDLPYDLNAEVISIGKDDYTVFYIDMLDNPERYVGKTVEFTAQTSRPSDMPEGAFVGGNMVMTCCEDDMQFMGFVCYSDNADRVKNGATMKLRGKVELEKAYGYEQVGPVIRVEKTTTMPSFGKKKKK